MPALLLRSPHPIRRLLSPSVNRAIAREDRLDGWRVASEDRRQVLVHLGLYRDRVIVAIAIDDDDHVPLTQEARDRLIGQWGVIGGYS